jgi:hypothetical protein
MKILLRNLRELDSPFLANFVLNRCCGVVVARNVVAVPTAVRFRPAPIYFLFLGAFCLSEKREKVPDLRVRLQVSVCGVTANARAAWLDLGEQSVRHVTALPVR